MAQHTKAGKGGGESIPAMLAATPAKPASTRIVKTTKAAEKPAAKAPAPSRTAAAASTARAVAPKPPVVKAEPKPVAVEPVFVAAPAAPTVAAQAATDEAPIPSAVAPAPVVSTPPAAVPADIQKESQMATTIENAAQTTTDKAQAMFAETSERAKGAMAKSARLFEEANAFGKGNVEALVESSKIAAKGFETLGQDAAEFARKSFEDATAAFKTLASVKSPTEFMKLQGDFMRSAFDALVAETSRSTEQVLKLTGEVAQPISNRMAVAADKMKIAA